MPFFGREDALLIGAHESIAGGFDRAIHRAVEDGCRAAQIFTGSPGRWEAPPIEPGTAQGFQTALEQSGVQSVLVHARYLINPASPDPHLWIRSMMALREEYERAGILGVDGLVIHPGSHRGTTDEDGIRRASEMIGRLLEESKDGPPVRARPSGPISPTWRPSGRERSTRTVLPTAWTRPMLLPRVTT